MRISFFISLFLLISQLAFAQVTGKVISIADGDTYSLLTADKKKIKIRMHGIDCPEKAQPYEQKAKDYTSVLIFGRMVTAQIIDTDRYGRIVAITRLQDGRILNEELIKAGFAWHYKRYDRKPSWARYENEARAAKRGLWADKQLPIAPWEWRRK